MNNEELKLRVGANIARLRRERNMTQAELAERINYSDKAVSKWERGESMPDVLTLLNLAEQLGTDLNTLAGIAAEAAPAPQPEPEAAPVKVSPVEEAPAAPKQKLSRTADKKVIQKLCTILVWVVALFLHLLLDAFGVRNLWMLYVIAVPANAIVLLSLRSAWHDFRWNRAYISVIVWGVLLSFYVTMWVFFGLHVWRVFLLGIPGQIAIFLWFRMFRPAKEKEEDAPQEEEESHE